MSKFGKTDWKFLCDFLATYIFEMELVEHNLKVNEGLILFKHGLEIFTNVRVKMIIGNIQTEETFVCFQSIDEVVLHARCVIATHGQLVGFQVQESERGVYFEHEAKLFGRFWSKLVTF